MALTHAQKRISLVFILSGLSIAFFVSIAYFNMRFASGESRKVNAALQRLLLVENLLTNIQSIESSQRGFIITGNRVFLENHKASVDELEKRLVNFSNNEIFENQHQLLSEFESLLRQKVAFSQSLLDIHSKNRSDSVQYLLSEGRGYQLMNRIRQVSAEIEEVDRQALRRSNVERRTEGEKNVLIFVGFGLLVFLLLYFNYRIIKKELTQTIINETRFREHDLLISNIADPIMATDINFRITRWNDAMEVLLGYSFPEVKGKFSNEVLQPEFPHSSFGELREQLLNKGIWEGEASLLHKNGSRVHIQSKVSTLKEPDGTVIGAISVLTDITQRKQIEQRLKDLTEKLEEEVSNKVAELNQVYDRIADSVIALDNQWNYTYLNRKAIETHGLGDMEIVGKNMLEIFPSIIGSPIYHGILKAIETKQSVRLEDYYNRSGEWFESIVYPSENGVSIYYHVITERKNAEHQLAKAYEELDRHARELAFINERFQLVARATNDAIWDYDMRKNIVTGNVAFTDYFNIPPDGHVSYEKFLEHLHPDDAKRIDENMIHAVNQKQHGLREEFRFRYNDGTYRTVSDRAYILYDDEGLPYRMLGAMQDITAQKQAQLQLLQEKELSETIINSLPGIFYHFDNEGRYLRWNRNLEIVSGYSAEEIRYMTPLDFYSPGDKEAVLDKIRGTFASRGSDSIEADLLLKNGNKIPYIFTGRVVLSNGVETMVGIGLDISEKVRSQQALAKSEERYRTLIEQASDGILISDRAGKYISVNTSAERISGYSREELLDMSISDLFFMNDRQPHSPDISDFLKGEIVIDDLLLKRKDGKILNVELSSKLLSDGRFQSIVRDITDRVIAEGKLKRSHSELRQLASHLQSIREEERTHMAREIHDELGQQLTGLKMDLAWIKRKLNGALPEVVDKINETSTLVDETVKTVRRLSAKLRPSILDDLGIVPAMEWHSEEFQKRSGIETRFSTNAPDLVLPADTATALFRIYQESLTNVSRHADATKVESSLMLINNEVILTIKDNGKGFEAPEVARKKTLGLLGMKERTLLLGGSYEISGKKGKGTSVTIRIPVGM